MIYGDCLRVDVVGMILSWICDDCLLVDVVGMICGDCLWMWWE